MDGQRFDDVARLIGAGASRRSVLKGLSGGLLGIAGIGVAARVARAQDATPCVDDGDCSDCEVCAKTLCIANCTAGEGDSCCDAGETCNAETGTCDVVVAECQGDADCADCEACAEGTCVFDCTLGEGDACCADGAVCNDDGTCAVVCAGEGELCVQTDAVGAECCAGFACNSEFVCEAIAEPVACETDDDCGEGEICCGGFCIADIECCIDDEDPNARCAEGSTCFEGVCVFACKGDSDCAEGTCCCSDGTCSSECCEDVDNTPPADTGGVTTLPNTGIGDGDGNLTGLLGAGLVAGAAAYLAGKKVKGSEQA